MYLTVMIDDALIFVHHALGDINTSAEVLISPTCEIFSKFQNKLSLLLECSVK